MVDSAEIYGANTDAGSMPLPSQGITIPKPKKKGILDNSFLKGAMNVLGTPEAIITSTAHQVSGLIAEGIDAATGGDRFQVNGKEGFSLRNWWDQIYHPAQRLSGGDFIAGAPDKGLNSGAFNQLGGKGQAPAWLTIPGGFALDVALDPTSYLAPWAKGADVLDEAGNVVKEGKMLRSAKDIAGHIEEDAKLKAMDIRAQALQGAENGIVDPIAQGAQDADLQLAALQKRASEAMSTVRRGGGLSALSDEDAAYFNLRKGLRFKLGDLSLPATNGQGVWGSISRARHVAETHLGDVLLGGEDGAARLGRIGASAELRNAARAGKPLDMLNAVVAQRVRTYGRAVANREGSRAADTLNVAYGTASEDQIRQAEDVIDGLVSKDQVPEDVQQLATRISEANEIVGHQLVDNGVMNEENLLKKGEYFPSPVSQLGRQALEVAGLSEGGDVRLGGRSFLEQQRTLWDPSTGEGGIGQGENRIHFTAKTRGEAEATGGKEVAARIKAVAASDTKESLAARQFMGENPEFMSALEAGESPIFKHGREAVVAQAKAVGNRIARVKAGKELFDRGYGIVDPRFVKGFINYGLTPEQIMALGEEARQQAAHAADLAQAAREMSQSAAQAGAEGVGSNVPTDLESQLAASLRGEGPPEAPGAPGGGVRPPSGPQEGPGMGGAEPPTIEPQEILTDEQRAQAARGRTDPQAEQAYTEQSPGSPEDAVARWRTVESGNGHLEQYEDPKFIGDTYRTIRALEATGNLSPEEQAVLDAARGLLDRSAYVPDWKSVTETQLKNGDLAHMGIADAKDAEALHEAILGMVDRHFPEQAPSAVDAARASGRLPTLEEWLSDAPKGPVVDSEAQRQAHLDAVARTKAKLPPEPDPSQGRRLYNGGGTSWWTPRLERASTYGGAGNDVRYIDVSNAELRELAMRSRAGQEGAPTAGDILIDTERNPDFKGIVQREQPIQMEQPERTAFEQAAAQSKAQPERLTDALSAYGWRADIRGTPPQTVRRIVVTGGREVNTPEEAATIIDWLKRKYGEDITIVHGDARGVDRTFGKAAEDAGLNVEKHPADWAQYGNSAGPRRNIEMADANVDLAIQFPGGKGTAHMARTLDERGIPTIRVGPGEAEAEKLPLGAPKTADVLEARAVAKEAIPATDEAVRGLIDNARRSIVRADALLDDLRASAVKGGLPTSTELGQLQDMARELGLDVRGRAIEGPRGPTTAEPTAMDYVKAIRKTVDDFYADGEKQATDLAMRTHGRMLEQMHAQAAGADLPYTTPFSNEPIRFTAEEIRAQKKLQRVVRAKKGLAASLHAQVGDAKARVQYLTDHPEEGNVPIETHSARLDRDIEMGQQRYDELLSAHAEKVKMDHEEARARLDTQRREVSVGGNPEDTTPAWVARNNGAPDYALEDANGELEDIMASRYEQTSEAEGAGGVADLSDTEIQQIADQMAQDHGFQPGELVWDADKQELARKATPYDPQAVEEAIPYPERQFNAMIEAKLHGGKGVWEWDDNNEVWKIHEGTEDVPVPGMEQEVARLKRIRAMRIADGKSFSPEEARAIEERTLGKAKSAHRPVTVLDAAKDRLRTLEQRRRTAYSDADEATARLEAFAAGPAGTHEEGTIGKLPDGTPIHSPYQQAIQELGDAMDAEQAAHIEGHLEGRQRWATGGRPYEIRSGAREGERTGGNMAEAYNPRGSRARLIQARADAIKEAWKNTAAQIGTHEALQSALAQYREALDKAIPQSVDRDTHALAMTQMDQVGHLAAHPGAVEEQVDAIKTIADSAKNMEGDGAPDALGPVNGPPPPPPRKPPEGRFPEELPGEPPRPKVPQAFIDQANRNLMDASRWQRVLTEAQKIGDDATADMARMRITAAHLGQLSLSEAKDAADKWEAFTKISESRAARDAVNSQLVHGAIDWTRHRAMAPGYLTPVQMSDLVNHVSDFYSPAGQSRFWNGYRSMVHWMRVWQITSPGFHIRNMLGGVFNNALADTDWNSYREFASLWHKAHTGQELTAEETKLWQQVEGIATPGQIGSERSGSPMGFLATGKGRGRFFSSRGVLPRISEKAGSNVEFMLRGTLAYDTLKKGGSIVDAANQVAKFHFDYSDLSKGEQWLKANAVPFYTWTRFNTPLQLEMIGKNPRVYARFAHFQTELERASGADPITPGYFSELNALRLPFTKGGGHLYLVPDLPLRDLNLVGNPIEALRQPGDLGDKFVSAFSEPIALGTPLVAGPVEWMLGRQVYKGIPLHSDRGVALKNYHIPDWLSEPLRLTGLVRKDPKTGHNYMTERDFYLLQKTIPILGRYQRLGGSSAPKDKANLMSHLLSFFLGTQIRTNTKDDQQVAQYIAALPGKTQKTISYSLGAPHPTGSGPAVSLGG